MSYGLEVDRPLQRTVTDPAGRYRFPMVPVGRAELRAGGRWHGLQTRSVQISHVTETVADLFLELGSTVRGRVHWPAAEEGDPVAEAMVIFEARDGTHADRERVSMQGTFVVPNLPHSPGRLSLQLTNHPFPIAWMDHVIADGGEVEFDLREVLPIHGGLRLRVQEDLEASPGTIEVRVVQIETGHVSFVERMRDGSHTITGLPAGSYRVLVCADVHGSQDLGQFWVDGRRITDLGLRTLPRPAVLGIEHVAPVGWIGPELYLRRPELDLRLWPTQMPEHGELRLPEGIWLALWRDSSGSIAGVMTRLHAGRRSHLVE